MKHAIVLPNNTRFNTISGAILSLEIGEKTKIVIKEKTVVVDFLEVSRINDKKCLIFTGPCVLQGIKRDIRKVSAEY